MTNTESLAKSVEAAVAEFLGVDYPIPTEEWAAVCDKFALCCERVAIDADNRWEASLRAKQLTESIGQLVDAFAEVVS